MVQTPTRSTQPIVTWEPLPDDFHLPDDPVENIQQPPLAAALTDALGTANRLKPTMLIGSNFGLVTTINGKTVVKAPDWFYVPEVKPSDRPVRRSYTQYLQGDRIEIVMEFLSEEDNGELSIRATPPYGKLFVYERILQVPIYVIYDPYTNHLDVWQLEGDRYVAQTPNEAGRFWIPCLELYLGIWFGERLAQTMNWLRWWNPDGNLLLWGIEKAEQERQIAEQERQRAEQEHQRAEQEHQIAEQERQRAEQEHQIAEQERQRAEQERQIAEQERQRAERLAALLREQGIDPDKLPD